jgi:lysophospholipase L1-like esterase
LLALLLGAGLVLLAEGGLRLVPSLAPPAFAVLLARRGEQALYAVNPAYAQRFFGGELRGMRLAPRPFVEPALPGALRVVFAGASTVQGFPHAGRLNAAAYLEAMLRDSWPDRPVEVFNVGITAVSSFAVARAVEDAAVLKPELVVVYTGHNELYGVYGAAALRQGGQGLWAKKLHYALMQWRLAGLMRRLLAVWRPLAEPSSTSLLQVMAQAGPVPPGDPRRRQAEENLRASLLDIAAFCRQRGIALMLCTPASNERGFAPAPAELPGGLSPVQKETWQLFLSQARENLEIEPARALALLDSAAAIWAEDALLHFWRGKCLEALGQSREAHQAFIRSRDLDTRPWRAPEAYAHLVRRLAQEEGALLADVVHAFRQASPPAGIGWELMADHLHPSAAGQVLLARTMVAALEQAPGRLRVAPEDRARLGEDEAYGRLLGDLPVERLAVARSMAGLLSERPLDQGNEVQVQHLREEVQALWQGLSPGEKRGVERWRGGQGPDLLVLNVADQLFAAQEFGKARLYYAAARREAPYTLWGDLWAALRWGRCLEMEQGALDEEGQRAVEAVLDRALFLAQAPDLDPALMEFFLGYAQHLLGQREAALVHLEKAAADAGVRRLFFFDLLALLCENLLAQGRFAQAEQYVRQVAQQVGQPEYGRFLLGQIEKARQAVR